MRKYNILLLLVLGAAVSLFAAVASSDDGEVRINDECDSHTFPPQASCVGDGDVTFQEFLAKLNPQDGGHRAWNFHFDGHLEAGRMIRVENEGGEPHSFVEVSAYGTGVVPPLNGALPPGTAPAVPVGGGSLDQANGANIVLPGASRSFAGLSPGVHKFQCLIHPWMRLEVDVRNDKDKDHDH